jgi:hypothetical protein
VRTRASAIGSKERAKRVATRVNSSKLAVSPVDKRSWPNASAGRFTTM